MDWAGRTTARRQGTGDGRGGGGDEATGPLGAGGGLVSLCRNSAGVAISFLRRSVEKGRS